MVCRNKYIYELICIYVYDSKHRFVCNLLPRLIKNFFFLFKDFNFCVCFWDEILLPKNILPNITHLYKKCAQIVNVQYKVLILYETKPGKKLCSNASLLFSSLSIKNS